MFVEKTRADTNSEILIVFIAFATNFKNFRRGPSVALCKMKLFTINCNGNCFSKIMIPIPQISCEIIIAFLLDIISPLIIMDSLIF